MSDKTLHRKLFREKALRTGALKPEKAILGGLIPIATNLLGRGALGAIARRQLAASAKRGMGNLGKGTLGSLQAAEIPFGAYQTYQGASEGDAGQSLAGLGWLYAGLGQAIPGLRQVGRVVRKRGSNKVSQGMSDAGSKYDQGLAKLQGKIEQTPYLGKAYKVSKENPWKVGGAAAALEGINYATAAEDEILSPPTTSDIAGDDPTIEGIISPEGKPPSVDLPKKPIDPSTDKEGNQMYAIEQARKDRENVTDPKNQEVDEEPGNPTAGSNDVTQGIKNTGDKRIVEINKDIDATNINSFNDFKNFMDSGEDLGSRTVKIQERINKQFAQSKKLIEEAREALNERQKETFDEYFTKFKEYSGAGNEQRGMYLLWQLGSGLAQARTDKPGFTGFLESLNQAGGQVFETAFALNQKDIELRRSLASNYIDYERNLEEQARLENRQLDQEERGLVQSLAALGIELDEKQKDRDNDLKLKYLDYKSAKNKGALGKKNVRTVRIDDPDAYAEQRVITIYEDDSGQTYEEVQLKDEDGNVIGVEARPFYRQAGQPGEGGYTPMEPNKTGMLKAKTNMEMSAAAVPYVKEILHLAENGYQTSTGEVIPPEDFLGFRGRVMQAVYSMSNVFNGIGLGNTAVDSGWGMISEEGNSAGSVATIEKMFSTTDQMSLKILDTLDKRALTEDGEKDEEEAALMKKEFFKSAAAAKSDANLNKWSKKMFKESFSSFKDKDDQASLEKRWLISRLSVMEHKLKYMLANSSKFADRLTQKDVQAAGEKTSLLKLLDGKPEIIGRYRAILGDSIRNWELQKNIYIEAGGSPNLIPSQYPDMPSVKEWRERKGLDKKQGEKKAPLKRLTTKEQDAMAESIYGI